MRVLAFRLATHPGLEVTPIPNNNPVHSARLVLTHCPRKFGSTAALE